MNSIALIVALVVCLMPLPARARYHVPIAQRDELMLSSQPLVVDIDVLDNDFGPGRDSLHVVSATGAGAARIEVIDGSTVRVVVDWRSHLAWPAAGYGGVMGRVAYGTYVVSNGYARSQAQWAVWYVPDMRV
ncbi:MAG: hypothetical protein R2844_16345 [Caldilineales bacterium]